MNTTKAWGDYMSVTQCNTTRSITKSNNEKAEDNVIENIDCKRTKAEYKKTFLAIPATSFTRA